MPRLVWSAVASAVFMVLAIAFAVLEVMDPEGWWTPLVVAFGFNAVASALLSLRER